MNQIMKPIGSFVYLLTILVLMICSPVAEARGDDATTAAEHARRAKDDLPAFTKAREAAAIVFIKQQRPELLELLKLVQEKSTAEYQKAICQFFNLSEKVADANGQDNGAVAIALQAWQTQIQSQILGAQMLQHPDQIEELKQQLHKVVAASVDLQIAHVDQQIAQAEQQLMALRKQKESLASRRDAIIQARIADIEQLVARHREGDSLQAEFEPLVREIREAAVERQQQGGDVSAVAELMQQLGPLVREGRVDEARAVLKKASELLKE